MAEAKRIETFATGMVRPKTTALFFDRLWVHPALIRGFNPDDELEPYRVPAELCALKPMGIVDYYDSWLTQSAYTPWWEVARTSITEALQLLGAESWDLNTIFQVEALQHFDEMNTPLMQQLLTRLPQPRTRGT